MNPQDFSKNHPVALIVILCVLALGACYLSFALMSVLSGWHTLSKRFGLNDGDEFDGITEGMQSGRMGRFGRYQNSLRLGANDEGLYVSVPGLFVHPPCVCALARDQDRSTKACIVR
jgi:hypothetical protein